MGVIYKATSPSGRSYVGQTKYTAPKRWKEHISEAYTKMNNQCTFLNAAIRKHGGDNFVMEILWEGDKEELDVKEIEMIATHGTLYPGGYNLTKGGQTGCAYYSPELREKISKRHRKVPIPIEIEDWTLPMYVHFVVVDDDIDTKEGFRVNIPNLKSHKVTSIKLTLRERYYAIMKIYVAQINGEDTQVQVKKVPNPEKLPDYVSYAPKTGAYIVAIPGKQRKTFQVKTMSREERKQLALTYYSSISE